MNCTHCHYDYDNAAQYCAQCGNKTIYNPTRGKSNNNVTAVWLFAGVSVFISLLYRLTSHIIIPVMRRGGKWEAITSIYRTEAIVSLLLELLVCGIIIGIIKNTSARIAVGLYAVAHLMLFVFEKAMEAIKMGAYGGF